MILTDKYIIYGVTLGDFLKDFSSTLKGLEFDSTDQDYGVEVAIYFPCSIFKEDFENALRVSRLLYKID